MNYKYPYLITIPSKARAAKQLTVKLLDGCYPADQIYVFVEPQDYEHYQTVLGIKVMLVNIGQNDRGVAYVRNYILDYMQDKAKFIWMLDDDLTELYKRGEFLADKQYYKLETLKPEEIKKILDDSIEYMIKSPENIAQVAISYTVSNWCNLKDVSFNARAWAIVAWNLALISKGNLRYDPNCKTFDDYDITAQVLRRGFKNVLVFKYAFGNAKMSKTEGGLFKVYQDKAGIEQLVDYLIKKWGSAFVEKFYNEGHKQFEPQFHWAELAKNKAADLRGWLG